ncbi:MAG TPA: peptidylprolyl isomerase, partial [Burkholderiaceae bacterium]|nr:peptidylprolyl isomerase [Burkholderiaceae bacterium]
MTKTVEMTTSEGTIRIELDDVKAPASTENFLAYVRSGHYDGTVFHRVIKGFMVQGGGFATGMKQKPTRAPVVTPSILSTTSLPETTRPNTA